MQATLFLSGRYRPSLAMDWISAGGIQGVGWAERVESGCPRPTDQPQPDTGYQMPVSGIRYLASDMKSPD
jgi:hypothetical protein